MKRIRDFLQRRAAYKEFVSSIRPADTFLVSYPRSGVTWLIAMISTYLELSGMNVPGGKFVIDLSAIYNRLGKYDRTLKDFEDYPNPRIFKIHSPFGYEPSYPKVVYLVRDPRSVLVSLWHFRKMQQQNFNLSLQGFITGGQHWKNCSWSKHVNDWLVKNRHPQLVCLRYEDLHQNPMDEFKKSSTLLVFMKLMKIF